MSKIVRKAVNDSGLSVYELAERAGINRSIIWRFMEGGDMRTDNLDAVCRVLGLTITKARKGDRK